MDILKKLQDIVCEYRNEKIELKPETTFDDLGFDSLDKVELLMKLEEEFNFQFPDDIQVSGVQELVDIIKKNI
ncbi:MAG: acyl carrier protein [Clostridiales bacterium]|nr:acyl carrier protein [Clostridiales bacterium]